MIICSKKFFKIFISIRLWDVDEKNNINNSKIIMYDHKIIVLIIWYTFSNMRSFS